MKNTLEELAADWTLQKKILIHEDTAIETIKNKIGKKSKKLMNRVSEL